MHASDEHSFLTVPTREGKPRERGLTHVMDKGLNLREIEGLFDTAGEYVDIVKLGWGTSYVTNNLEKKIALYRSFSTPVVCGGTLFEAVYGQGKMDEFKRWLEHFRFSHVEISDGTLDIPREQKLELIADFAHRLRRPLRGRLEGLRGQHRARTSGCSGSARSSTRARGRSSPRVAKAAPPASTGRPGSCGRGSSTRSSTRSRSTTSSGRRRRSPRRPGSSGTSGPR